MSDTSGLMKTLCCSMSNSTRDINKGFAATSTKDGITHVYHPGFKKNQDAIVNGDKESRCIYGQIDGRPARWNYGYSIHITND